MNHLHFVCNNIFYRPVLEYIYELNKDNINDFMYLEELNIRTYHYRYKSALEEKEKVLIPGEIESCIIYNGEQIHFKHEVIRDQYNNIQKFLIVNDCCGGPKGEIMFSKITLAHQSKDVLIKFADDARERIRNKLKKSKIKSKDTIRIYYYKEYWDLFSKIPKRDINTIYLKEGELEKLVNNISEFFTEDIRKEYISYGIPYKNVTFLYGTPGSGKTSTINTIASYFSCDIFIIPLSSDMDDTHLVDAFSGVNSHKNDDDNPRKLIVIEDIDCIFADRKEGDHLKNKLTLQGLLNCLDGFTCIEGGLIFITANNPEALDDAIIRSCRVDYKLELSYANKYQTQKMFNKFIPHQPYNFDKFYKNIAHKKYSTAMLQEFLFANRKCINILDKLDELMKIIEKNDSNNLNKKKQENMNMQYM